MMTVNRLLLLLAIHSRGDPRILLGKTNLTQNKLDRSYLIKEGLITPLDEAETEFRVTDKGKALITAIINLPMPVATWVMPTS